MIPMASKDDTMRGMQRKIEQLEAENRQLRDSQARAIQQVEHATRVDIARLVRTYATPLTEARTYVYAYLELASTLAVLSDAKMMNDLIEILGIDRVLSNKQVVLADRAKALAQVPGTPDRETLLASVSELGGWVARFIEGLQFLKNGDGGAYLRLVASDASESERYQELLKIHADLDFGGRPTGTSLWRQWLKQQWLEIEASHPNESAGEIRSRLVNVLSEWDKEKNEYVIKAGATVIESRARNSLFTDTALKQPSAYRKSLLGKAGGVLPD